MSRIDANSVLSKTLEGLEELQMATSVVPSLSVLLKALASSASTKIPVEFSVLMVAVKPSVLVVVAGPVMTASASPSVALLSVWALASPSSLQLPISLPMLILPVPEPISDQISTGA